MKTFILVSIAIITSLASSAQMDSMTKVRNREIMKDNMRTINNQNIARKEDLANSETTAVFMKNCKMMIERGGKTMPMKHNVTMRNGTIVMATGLIIDADSTTTMMSEGEYIDIYGKIEFSHVLHKYCKIE